MTLLRVDASMPVLVLLLLPPSSGSPVAEVTALLVV
jgi:hypothetical protein